MAIVYGNNSLNIVGNGNQFIVVYTAAVPVFPVEVAQIALFDQGPVLSISTGGTSVTLTIDNARFVVEYNQPPGSPGNNVVKVDGGNNAFVVTYEASFVSAGRNMVNVTGDGSRFVIAYQQPAEGNYVVIDGDLNQFVVANDVPQTGATFPVSSGMDPSVFSSDSRDNFGVIVGTPTSDTVRVDGNNNLFVIQYSAPPGSNLTKPGVFPIGSPMSVAEPSTMALLACGLVISRLWTQARGRLEP